MMVIKLVGLWLRLHSLKWQDPYWIMAGKEIIPEYVMLGWMIVELVGIAGIGLTVALWIWA